MKYLRWATLALVLCFSAVACATTVEAAQTGAAGDGKKVSAKKATTSEKNKKSSSTAKTEKKKAAASKSSKAEKEKKTKSTAARSGKSKDKSKKQRARKTGSNERQIWMQRAQGSSELLGKASWYGSDFHGGRTASGEEYDMYTYTAAHRTLPLGTVVEVTEENSGRTVMVCINNRGPFKPGRVIDLSYAAADDLGIRSRGVAPVNLRVVSDPEGQPLNSDEAFYVQLARKRDARQEKVGPFAQYADASVMQEVLRNQYPEASIVLGPAVASK